MCYQKRNWRTRNNVTYEPQVAIHAEYNLLCYASLFATLNLFIMKKNNSHTVLYAIQYTRTFIMICKVEIHPIDRFNVACQTVSRVIT